jgi:hypothetical protein
LGPAREIGFVMPYFAAVCGEEPFGLSESTISASIKTKSPTPKQTNLKATMAEIESI